MSKYLVTLKPLEPYFFGNERTLQFPGQLRTEVVKSEYYIESEEVPSQTTILGILRFLILKKADKLTNPNSPASLKTEQESLVGKNGFEINCDRKGNYGKLKSIGSLFLIDDKEKQYIPCPLNHQKAYKQYMPFPMKPLGDFFFPTDYDAKEGLAEAYLCFDQHLTIVERKEIFKDHEQVGIQAKPGDKAFFKRKYKILEKKYRFAYYVEAEEDSLPAREVITMGQQKTPFLLEVKRDESNLEEKIQETFCGLETSKDYTIYYALSPILFQQELKGLLYHINQNKLFQCLQGKQNGIGHKRTALREMVQAGSVFYVKKGMENEFEQSYQNENYENIGLNQMIIMGGK